MCFQFQVSAELAYSRGSRLQLVDEMGRLVTKLSSQLSPDRGREWIGACGWVCYSNHLLLIISSPQGASSLLLLVTLDVVTLHFAVNFQ